MSVSRSWCSPLICCALFIVVYILLRLMFPIVNNEPHSTEYGLLLFIVPGIITCHITQRADLANISLGAMAAIPLCLVIRYLFFVQERSPLQELAYNASAIFWCLSGALMYWFVRSMVISSRRQK
ncbi:inner membrane protein YbjM [Edaphovirga cremea]|jgi:hypothetical protein|uniref:inner membrane protein YbjM n=1 Tax=Edaphovirga cremea TaxID=2267246 RepID=UPI000DF00178|nr:inner membrane protein YbjM [Edaphovirga cremea]